MAITGYIIDKVDSKFLTFTYYQGLSNSVSAEYHDQGIHGRSEPHSVYVKTGPDTYQFNLTFAASDSEGDSRTAEDVWNDYLFLKSFQFPDYSSGKQGPVKPAHEVIIRIGNFFRKEGVIRDPSFDLNATTDTKGFPHQIKCTFTFRVIHKGAIDLYDVRNGL